jgi:hypothetical protein
MQRRDLLATVPPSLIGIAGCVDGQRTGSSANSSAGGEQGSGSSIDSEFSITNKRDSDITVSLRLTMGQDTEADDVFRLANETDNEINVSSQLEDGDRSFTLEGLMLKQGATMRFEAQFADVVANMSIAVEILSPDETTYKETGIPVGAPDYDITIQPDRINVIWAEY